MSFRLWTAGLALAVLSGCASFVAPPYSPDYGSLDRLKSASLDKASVGPAQPRDPSAPVNRISLRGTPMVSPNGSYAQYLENALIQDLKELSVYQADAGLRIDATLLRNEMDIFGINTGHGRISAELAVTRDGTQRLRKTYHADTTFESSFAGNVAIPRGQLEYARLVQALLSKVYADPEFINSLKKENSR